MGEIMRWRLARAAQRRIPDAKTLVDLGSEAYQINASMLRKAQGVQAPTGQMSAAPITYDLLFSAFSAQNSGIQPPPPQLIEAGLALDQWLASVDNRPTVAALTQEVNALLGQWLPNSPDWQNAHKILAFLYYAGLYLAASGYTGVGLPFSITEALGWATRYLLVMALVDTLERDPKSLQTPDDVYAALRWRTLVLPASVVNKLRQIRSEREAILVRKPGFADLYITREEWDHYEAAEIASIENILGRELKSRVHILVNQTQVTTTTEETTTTLKEQDTTTTDLSQLQQQSSSDITIAAHIDGQVNTSGQYGATQVNTHLGGSLDYSNASATSKATTQSHETVARAVSKVEQTTRQVRTVSTLTKSTDREEHKFDNTQDADPVVGIYRWVDQIQNVELDRYPHRLIMEFEIPEPGAWTRWLHLNDAARNMINKPPPPFLNSQNSPLQPSDLTAASYQTYVARYAAVGVSPPPGPQYITAALKRDMPTDEYNTKNPDWKNQPVYSMSDTSASVPSGYYASSWTASVEGWTWGSQPGNFMDVVVGSGAHQSVASPSPGGSIQANASGTVTLSGLTGVSVGNVPISVMTNVVWGFVVNVVIECDPLPETITTWQANTYDLLVGAYNALLQAYNDEKAGLTIQQTNLADASSPDQNAKTAKQELKRQVIEMLIGKPFWGLGAITWDPTGVAPPRTILPAAAAIAPGVQFLEQAFEWETLSYICYPYYWADSSRWGDLAAIQGNDSDFADFLRAGSARVVVPARPGFEDQVNFYVEFGILWGGGPMPAPGDENYLSIADEIRAQQQRPLDVTVIDTWQVRLPTTLIWLENPDGLPKNPNPTIVYPFVPSVALSRATAPQQIYAVTNVLGKRRRSAKLLRGRRRLNTRQRARKSTAASR